MPSETIKICKLLKELPNLHVSLITSRTLTPHFHQIRTAPRCATRHYFCRHSQRSASMFIIQTTFWISDRLRKLVNSIKQSCQLKIANIPRIKVAKYHGILVNIKISDNFDIYPIFLIYIQYCLSSVFYPSNSIIIHLTIGILACLGLGKRATLKFLAFLIFIYEA